MQGKREWEEKVRGWDRESEREAVASGFPPAAFFALCPPQFLVTHRCLRVGVERPLALRILALSPLLPFPSPWPRPPLPGQARTVPPREPGLPWTALHGRTSPFLLGMEVL